MLYIAYTLGGGKQGGEGGVTVVMSVVDAVSLVQKCQVR